MKFILLFLFITFSLLAQSFPYSYGIFNIGESRSYIEKEITKNKIKVLNSDKTSLTFSYNSKIYNVYFEKDLAIKIKIVFKVSDAKKDYEDASAIVYKKYGNPKLILYRGSVWNKKDAYYYIGATNLSNSDFQPTNDLTNSFPVLISIFCKNRCDVIKNLNNEMPSQCLNSDGLFYKCNDNEIENLWESE